jgi:hypothetical protein
MLKKIAIGVAALLAVLAIVIATRPSTYTVKRSATIAAPADVIFAKIADFHGWEAWSPWDKLDPAMKRTFDGPASGSGAIYAWTGNDDVGEGRMTIIESRPNEHVGIRLEFLKPFAATSTTTFDLAAAGALVTVTWTMVGNNDFMGKAFTLFMDMDKMIGTDFEKGLSSLKTDSETDAKKRAEAAAAKKAAEAAAAAAAAAEQAPPSVAPGATPPTK